MKKTTAAAALFLAFSSLAMSAAHADVIYYFSKVGVYKNVPINYANVFATATFSTDTSSGPISTVNLTMRVLQGLDAGGYVNDWAFNIKDNLTIGNVSWVSGAVATNTKYGTNNIVNNFGGNPGGDFDLGFNFSTANPGQIAAGASSVYRISGASSLVDTDFNFANNKNIFSAVHVQGYGASSFYKGVIEQPPVINPPTEIPEPGTVALLGLGLLGFAAARRKAGKSRAA